jgi:hypothetical protein
LYVTDGTALFMLSNININMLLGLKMNYNFNETDEVNEFEVN